MRPFFGTAIISRSLKLVPRVEIERDGEAAARAAAPGGGQAAARLCAVLLLIDMILRLIGHAQYSSSHAVPLSHMNTCKSQATLESPIQTSRAREGVVYRVRSLTAVASCLFAVLPVLVHTNDARSGTPIDCQRVRRHH